MPTITRVPVLVVVDCDNDAVRIQRGTEDPIVIRPKRKGGFWMSDVLSVVEELINAIDPDGCVVLEKQDEGQVLSIAEWGRE